MPKLTISDLLPMPPPYPPLPRFLYNRERVVGERKHEHTEYILKIDEVVRDGEPIIPRVASPQVVSKRKPVIPTEVAQKELGDNHPARYYLAQSEQFYQDTVLINDSIEGWLQTKAKPSEELIFNL